MVVRTRLIAHSMLIATLVCGVISTALDYWYLYHKNGSKIYAGLWELCSTDDEKTCYTWKGYKDMLVDVEVKWIHACQAMMIIGVLVNAMAFVVTLYSTIKHSSVRGAQAFAVLAGICYIIAAVVFAAKYKDSISKELVKDDFHLHAGFGLSIVAGVVNLVACCTLAFGHTGTGYMSI